LSRVLGKDEEDEEEEDEEEDEEERRRRRRRKEGREEPESKINCAQILDDVFKLEQGPGGILGKSCQG
jgi:hypothetical protein